MAKNDAGVSNTKKVDPATSNTAGDEKKAMLVRSPTHNMHSVGSYYVLKMTHPPRIARNGRSGLSKALAKYASSFFKRKPLALCVWFTPTIELKQIRDNSHCTKQHVIKSLRKIHN